MNFIPHDTSPFLILWYLFLGFFVVVVLVNIICLIISRILEWKTKALIEEANRTGLKIKKHKGYKAWPL